MKNNTLVRMSKPKQFLTSFWLGKKIVNFFFPGTKLENVAEKCFKYARHATTLMDKVDFQHVESSQIKFNNAFSALERKINKVDPNHLSRMSRKLDLFKGSYQSALSKCLEKENRENKLNHQKREHQGHHVMSLRTGTDTKIEHSERIIKLDDNCEFCQPHLENKKDK